jgi:hypothetical protein
MNISATQSTSSADSFHPDTIRFREYKLLMRAGHFSHPQQFHKFWKLTRRVAQMAGVQIRKRGKPMETHLREVLFFDTPKFRLYNHGFILRRRTFYKRGIPQPDHELTLKFRSSDYDEAAAVDVRPLLPCVNVVKFKEEVLMPREGSSGMRIIYSHGCELDTPNTILTRSFETITQVFPALQRIGAKQETALSIVNQLAIEEVLVNYGEIDFGGKMMAKANLAIWRNRMTQEPMVGEYTYQLKFPDDAGLQGKPQESSEAFYLKLQEVAHEWVEGGTTKTAMVYGMGNVPVTNHE